MFKNINRKLLSIRAKDRSGVFRIDIENRNCKLVEKILFLQIGLSFMSLSDEVGTRLAICCRCIVDRRELRLLIGTSKRFIEPSVIFVCISLSVITTIESAKRLRRSNFTDELEFSITVWAGWAWSWDQTRGMRMRQV